MKTNQNVAIINKTILKTRYFKSEVLILKVHTIKLKHVDILCSKCVIRVAKALSLINGIEELHVDLEKHQVQLKHHGTSISKEEIQSIIDNAIFANILH